MKQIIIIPITKIQELCNSTTDLKNFFNKVPLKSILDIIIDLENSSDLNQALWEEVEFKLNEYEIEKLDLSTLDFFFEIIIELFYEELYSVINKTDITFKVYHWLPDSVCLTTEKQNEIITNNYPASEF